MSALAYEPVQSLLAVGTNDSQFGPGQVYVFGQRRVCVTFNLPRRASVKEIQFCGDKLLVLDNKNDITVFSLDSRKQVAHYTPPGHVTAMVTDPTLDYCFTGIQNGMTLKVYELILYVRLTLISRRDCCLRSGPRSNDTLSNS